MLYYQHLNTRSIQFIIPKHINVHAAYSTSACLLLYVIHIKICNLVPNWSFLIHKLPKVNCANWSSSILPICSLSLRTSWKSSALSTSILPWPLASSSSDGCNRQSLSHTASRPLHHDASSTMRSSKSSTRKTTFSDIASTSSCNPRTNNGVLFEQHNEHQDSFRRVKHPRA